MPAGDDDAGPKAPGREANAKPLPKRFYAEVTAAPAAGGGATILLDGRTARTPGRRELRLPTLPLARAVAGEWAAQDDRIDPARMPLTRLANTAIDGVADQAAEVAADVVKYASSDLVCYRAERPDGLVARQAELWDPVLAWARTLGADLGVAAGIIHREQPAASLDALAQAIGGLDPFRLTALHTMTTLTGSALLSLGVVHAAWTGEAAWRAAHIDEDWQIAEWGEDAEAKARRERRWVEMAAAERMLGLLADG